MRYGKEALVDTSAIIDTADFNWPINRAIFAIMKHMDEEDTIEVFDSETIRIKAKTLGFEELFKSDRASEYMALLSNTSHPKENLSSMASAVKRWAIVRQIYNRFKDGQQYLLDLKGTESAAEIINKCESHILDFTTGSDGIRNIGPLTEGLIASIREKLGSDPVDQVGIPSGYPIWDECVGGGLRRATVNLIVARAKAGKSFHALNLGRRVSIAHKIPVLYLDSELNKSYQQTRLISMVADCPLNMFETGKFKNDPELVKKVEDAGQALDNAKITYASIAGMGIGEILSTIRYWIVRHVGFNQYGKANDCVVVYDYLKLMSSDGLSKQTPEYILLGLMMTDLHNFAVKYDIPIVLYAQTNREGINSDDTSIVSGSDRLLWLCSNLSVLRNKDDQDVSLNCGFNYGNKKLIILETRHGSGFTKNFDYINLHASLKPGVEKEKATGDITEGLLYSSLQETGQLNGTTETADIARDATDASEREN